ncbi:hypothetical protein JKA74_09370 [Marivirga sp. S37H4]|uniref:SMODS and SLOG-associating 2TM effector domain-containing protein n=1 Tax=Marivirga aurantiaca TaxID=2802615 RepID=A0A934WY07_9BACT|nr:hypothetical protein [Marivirga aurantiaca]MBK6265248.1 hypothetical protein [Marivirga aurantiaca]
MTNKIWYEMTNIKYGEIYLTKYLGLQRTLKKVFQILTLIVSLSGILGWKYFEDYVWIAFILIAIVQLLLLIENQIIRSDKEIEEISNLRMMYTRYFNKLERLWTKYHYDQIKDNKAMDKYFELRQSDWENIEELDCKLSIKRYKKLIEHTEIETNHYLNKYHING